MPSYEVFKAQPGSEAFALHGLYGRYVYKIDFSSVTLCFNISCHQRTPISWVSLLWRVFANFGVV